MSASKTTLMQFFHWYYPDGGKLWPEVAEKAESLARMGITNVWLPPAAKGASGGYSVGYDTYDLFDLGEFDQKGSRATKYGDREALEQAVHALKAQGLQVMYDVVFNHKMGADEKERVRVRQVDENDRTQISEEVLESEAYTRFTFEGRAGRHSEFVWDFRCFSGVDHIENPSGQGIFKLDNDFGEDGWNDEVNGENGNYDYLMGANIEYRNKAVREELKYWARWLMESLPCDGFRLDAVKHIPAWFFKDWLDHVRHEAGRDLLVVAEYWSPDMAALGQYLEQVDNKLMLFDAALHHRFHEASKQGAQYDLRGIFSDTLVGALPAHAVTLVANHDTQPLQSLEAPVEPWFKPLAYALILLREQGVPCVFYPDLYGARYTDKGHDGSDCEIEMPAIAALPGLIQARQRYAQGPQTDYFDDPNCIAFVRAGTAEAPGCVVVLSNGEASGKTIVLGDGHADAVFRDVLGHCQDEVVTDAQGQAVFPVQGGSVSVWVRADAIQG
ncbi:alpha-amylase [Comamonadaceae bacterium PP-2]